MKIFSGTGLLKCIALITVIIFFQSCKKKDAVNFDELIKRYSREKKDSLKLQCLIFIRENIKDVTSERPYFYNANGEREDFKLDTITSDSSLRAVLRSKKVKSSFEIIKDTAFLTSELLEENIDKAISDWRKYPWNKNVPKDVFLNYLLPYKILNENPDNWRVKLFQKYQDSIRIHEINGDKNSENLYSGLRNEAWSWLKYTGNFVKLTRSPSSTELLAVKKGECSELSNLFVYIARSAGIPATIDIVPMWGKTSGGHAADVFYGPIRENNIIKRYGLRPWDSFKSPPKVFRMSFKRTNLWSDSIKPVMNKKYYYLPRFLKSDHLLDVTKEYTPTLDLIYRFRETQNTPIAYICVSNYGEWKPVFYGRCFLKGKYAKFNDMAKNMAYHIAVPDGDSYKLVGTPFILDSLNNFIYSEPDFKKRINIVLEKTNIGGASWVRKSKKYALKYLDKNEVWKELDTKSCQKDSTMSFSNVPAGAFYMLEDKTANKKLDRIFLYKQGKQVWY